MTDNEFADLLEVGERPGVEFKNPRERRDTSFVEVVRAVLAMANRRNGGTIIIGIDDDGNARGLSHDQSTSWLPPDHVRQAIAPYADPYVYVDVVVHTVADDGPLHGRTFAVISVQE